MIYCYHLPVSEQNNQTNKVTYEECFTYPASSSFIATDVFATDVT